MPLRTCVGCRRQDCQADLVRFVRRGSRLVVATVPRLPGRGAYLHPNRDCVVKALRGRCFQRRLGVELQPAELFVLLGWPEAREPG
ncbi:MAG: hypothetical protein CSA64_01145 [Arachnia propionica]|nr:MAG: hypothetical protein CSA64_01145 [Arachnia propionica]